LYFLSIIKNKKEALHTFLSPFIQKLQRPVKPYLHIFHTQQSYQLAAYNDFPAARL